MDWGGGEGFLAEGLAWAGAREGCGKVGSVLCLEQCSVRRGRGGEADRCEWEQEKDP